MDLVGISAARGGKRDVNYAWATVEQAKREEHALTCANDRFKSCLSASQCSAPLALQLNGFLTAFADVTIFMPASSSGRHILTSTIVYNSREGSGLVCWPALSIIWLVISYVIVVTFTMDIMCWPKLLFQGLL